MVKVPRPRVPLGQRVGWMGTVWRRIPPNTQTNIGWYTDSGWHNSSPKVLGSGCMARHGYGLKGVSPPHTRD